jgi:hypothetical protein
MGTCPRKLPPTIDLQVDVGKAPSLSPSLSLCPVSRLIIIIIIIVIHMHE